VALQKLFAYGFIPAPLTMLTRVRKLPAGHWLGVPVSTLIPKITRYWEFQFDPFPAVPKDAEEQWGAELIRRLDEAVRIRLNADVPVGAFLSGGIDSTLVAKLASRHQKGIRSFSIGFTEKSFDEREYARLAASTIGTNHREEVLSIERCLELCAATSKQLDEVMGDSSILPTGLVARLAREDVKVVVTGCLIGGHIGCRLGWDRSTPERLANCSAKKSVRKSFIRKQRRLGTSLPPKTTSSEPCSFIFGFICRTIFS
jgi:asparagine synthase (glutamine-hydrolysing)